MRISVLIPAFNAAATLAETLASVHAQTLVADEVVVVDDGSTDSTAEIAADDPRVRLVRQANAGPAAALNAGLQLATGTAIALIDADDLWLPHKLHDQAAALSAEPALDGVFGHVEEFVSPELNPEQKARFQPREPQPGWLGGALLVRRALTERVGGFDPTLRVGYFIDWMDRARAAGARWRMSSGVVVRRRLHPGSLSHRSAATDRDMIAVARLALARRRTSAG